MKNLRADLRIKTWTKLLLNSVSKDETRPQLNGIFYCEKYGAVTCNGHTLFFDKTIQVPELYGKILNPTNYQLINREYVKFETFIPNVADMDKMTLILPKFKKQAGILPQSYHVYKHKETNEIKGIQVNGDHLELDDYNYLFTFNLNLILPLSGLTISVRYTESQKPLSFNVDYRQDDDETTNRGLIVMPLKA